jgi:hypothetical protein
MKSNEVIFAVIYLLFTVNEIKEMSRACSTNGAKKTAYRILVGSQKERDH